MPIEAHIEGLDKLVSVSDLFSRAKKQFAIDMKKAAVTYQLDAVGRSKKDYLSGPRPDRLGVVSGRLRSSMSGSVEGPDENGNLEVIVGTNVKYGPIWELGFDGVVNVDAHLRVVSKVFGKSVSATVAHVRAHTRKVHVEKKPFIEPPMRDAMPDFEDAIADALLNMNLGG